MDTTDKTVTAEAMLSGVTALKNDGTTATGNIATKTASNLSVSGDTVTAPAGYYASAASASVAAGNAGTPTATKGTVSNHSVSVTPSVTNTTGWITGSTKTGTAVTVNVSELESGTKSITQNGTGISVSGYSAVDVSVSGGADCPTFTHNLDNDTITCNKTYAQCLTYINGSVSGAFYVMRETGEDHYTQGATGEIKGRGTASEYIHYFVTGDVGVVGLEIRYDSDGTLTIIDPPSTVKTLSVTQNGTYNASYDEVWNSVSVSVEGGGTTAAEKQVNFIDYDGTIRYSYTAAEANALTALPANPSHSGLTAQGWNWTLAQIKAQLSAVPDAKVWVGQMYKNQTRDTEIDVTFMDSSLLSPYLYIAVDGTVTVDWGDNTSASTVDGTSLNTRKPIQHTYASTGSYTITVHLVTGDYTFYGSSNSPLLSKVTTASNSNRSYSNCVRAIRLGGIDIISIKNYAFQVCYRLASIAIPKTITSIGTALFSANYSLKSVTIPNSTTSITRIGSSTFANCYSLTSVSMPNSITSIESSAFTSCPCLTSITLHSGITTIASSAFASCSGLTSVTIPSSVTSIGNSAFSSCYGVSEYHIKPTVVPTLGTTVFNNIASDCVIYVPSAKLNDYKTAENWSAYASYMQGE